MTFEELYNAYHHNVMRTINSYVKHMFFSVDTKEDIAQTFWMNLYKLGNTFDNEAHFMTYARTSVRNICISLIRKEMTRNELVAKLRRNLSSSYHITIDKDLIIEQVIAYLNDEEKTCVIRFMDGDYISHIIDKQEIKRERVYRLIKNVQKRYIKEKNTRRKIFKICEYNGN